MLVRVLYTRPDAKSRGVHVPTWCIIHSTPTIDLVPDWIRTYSRATSAKLNSYLSYSILLFADLYKVYQTIPIISSKSSGLSLYFPDFFGANPCKIQLNFPHPERVSHSDTGALGSIQLHIHTGSNKSTLCGGSKMKKMIFRIFLFTPPAKSCLSVVHSLQ